MRDSICCVFDDDNYIDEFYCTEKMFCSHDNCTDCQNYKKCEFCFHEPYCCSRHGINVIGERKDDK